MGRGIDYGMGKTNVDAVTGIRYGVIHQNEVLQAWADSSEADYGPPTCPKCAGEVVEYDDDKHGDYQCLHKGYRSCAEYACECCERWLMSDDAYGDEPQSWGLDDGEYKAVCGSDGDIFITKSPYYTRAEFCSPCAPGACYLTNPCDDGERAYCFGHDWFDDGKAPYQVYRVDTGAEVLA